MFLNPCISKRIFLNKNDSIDNFLDILQTIKSGYHPLFKGQHLGFVPIEEIFCRGEPELFDSFLTPKIFRKEYRHCEEAELISAFKASFPELEKSLLSNMDWLSFMQHQGLPTRLLDWSTDPLVALYFAVGGDYNFEDDGIVYIIPIQNRIIFDNFQIPPIRLTSRFYSEFYAKLAEASILSEIQKLKYAHIPISLKKQGVNVEIQNGAIVTYYEKRKGEENKLTENPYVDTVEVFPPNSHSRIRAQSGKFTINYGKFINGKQILNDVITHKESYFVKNCIEIVIPKKIKHKLKSKLNTLGITEFALFPEEDKFYNDFIGKKYHPTYTLITGGAKDITPIDDLNKIEKILLKIDDCSLYPDITEVSIYHIIKLFKILGLRKVIHEILKKFLVAFIKKHREYIFKFLKIYNALDQFSKENKGNQKVVIEQLVKLQLDAKLLSKTIEIFRQENCNKMPNLNFDLQDNLFQKALKLSEIKKNKSQHNETELNQKIL